MAAAKGACRCQALTSTRLPEIMLPPESASGEGSHHDGGAGVRGVSEIECEFCGEKMHVLPERQPVHRFDRVDEGQRTHFIVAADGWLMHRCAVSDDDT